MPDAKELEEFKAYVLKQAPEGISAQEREEFVQWAFDQQGFDMPETEEPGFIDNVASGNLGGAGMQALDYGIRGLDYLGGGVRGAAGAMLGQSRPGDLDRVISGQAPTTEEYLERAGVPEGGSLSDVAPGMFSKSGVGLPLQKGGFMDPNLRDVGGFVGDVATDPLTYASLGVAPALKGAGILGKATAGAGKKTFASAFKNLDRELLEKGKKPLSEVFLENGVKGGSMKNIAMGAKEFGEKLSQQRKALYGSVDSMGAQVDTLKAIEPALEVISKMKQNPGKEELAKKLENFVEKYVTDAPVSVEKASDWKTAFYDTLPEASFKMDEFGRNKIKNDAKLVNEAMAKGFGKEIKAAADNVLPGAGKEISKVNEQWGSILSARKAVGKEVKKAQGKPLFSQVDAILGGGALATADPWAIGAFAAKQGYRGLMTPTAKTAMGRGMQKVGQSGVVDPLARRAAIDTNRTPKKSNYAPVSAWQKVGF